MKTSLFGIITLLVLSVSVSSAFAQSPEAESPIKMVLDLTKENLIESLDSAGEVPSTAQTFYDMGQEEYEKAIDALNSGDLEAAEEHALIAMALYEDSASVIGELEESLVLDQLPPGFGGGIDSSTESEGQGLGVGNIPPGIINQLSAANIFEIQEEITDIDEEAGGLRELIESNGLDINLEEYDESINLAKEVLANGDVPNAQAKLALANEIKDNLYDQIDAAVEESQDERIQEFAEEQINDIENILEQGENLGLTKKTIDELQETLEVLQSGEFDEIIEKTRENSEFVKEIEENEDVAKEFDDSAPGNSENAPGQNNDDGAPGNSENAPGQNNDDGLDTPPGFGASDDNPSENGFENGNGVGLGKLPPGLAKKMFDSIVDDGIGESFEDDGLENGFENLPPGLAKKFEVNFEQSADDSYEFEFEDSVDDEFEDEFDKTNKGVGKAKGKAKDVPGNSGNAPGQNNDDSASGNSGNSNKCKNNPFKKGCTPSIPQDPVSEGFPEIILNGNNPLGIAINSAYYESGATYSDNEDGVVDATLDNYIDSSGLDTSSTGEYTVNYGTVDLDGNITNGTRTVYVCTPGDVWDYNQDGCKKSNQTPEITVLGNNPENVSFGGVYVEDMDNVNAIYNNNKVSTVDVGGDVVNTSSSGTYIITYDSTRTQGANTYTALQTTRTVIVDAPAVQTAPLAITDLSAVTSSATKIDLSWTEPGNGGAAITDYLIEVSTTGDFTGEETTFVDGVSVNADAAVTGLSPSTLYYFQVSAINSINTGPVSNTDSDTTTALGATAPLAITDLSAVTSSATKIDLSWTEPGNGGAAITDYLIEVSTTGDFTGEETTFVDGVSVNADAAVTGLSPSTLYYFQVSAINSINTGPVSNTDSDTTNDPAPNNQPSMVSITDNFSVGWGTSGHSLSATASDLDSGDTLTYSWACVTQDDKITCAIQNANTQTPTFSTTLDPPGGSSRTITFTVTVTDDSGAVNDTVTDTVIVTVQ